MDEQKDKNSTDNPLESHIRHSHFVSGKLEKLATAIYMVTGFLNDKEPIKWRLREQALAIVTKLSSVSDNYLSHNLALFNDLLPTVRETVSLLDVGLAEGSVSRMNFSILKKEFLDLEKSIGNKESNWGQTLSSYQPVGVIDKPAQVQLAPVARPTKPILSYSQPKQNPVKPLKESVVGKKSDRSEQIIDFIKNHGWSAIKDISRAIPGCSTKTVQRELIALVDNGVLKKKGERRWSRYQLAEPTSEV